jgi:hypothetical protein
MANKAKTKLRPYKTAIEQAQSKSNAVITGNDEMVLFEFPDYDTYRDVQVAGNKAKLKMQYVKESHIKLLSDYLKQNYGPLTFGLCHGTRRGAEQRWFMAHLAGSPRILGTEISDTATDFADTVQWDFHDENPEWLDTCDFVYSNSWDHAYDPVKALGAWIKSLKRGGLLLLDYTKGQAPDAANALDPFGITYDRMAALLVENFSDQGKLLDSIDTRTTNPEYRARVFVFQKNA